MPSARAGARPFHSHQAGAIVLAVFGLAACGGGGSTGNAGPANAGTASGTVSGPAFAAAHPLPAGVSALPTFHMAAVTPPPPSDIDADGSNASALLPPLSIALSTAAADIDTTRLTPLMLTAKLEALALRSVSGGPTQSQRAAANAGATPQSATVYTPAQIRAAYGLPALPVSGAKLTTTDAMALGAGQTIYLVDAYDHPNAFTDLNTFSATFGLPTCTKSVVTPSTTLPLAAAAAGCQLLVAFPNASGAANASAPSYDAGWAPEIALDLQWSHAIAPLARIVLLESASASLSDLMGSVMLANRMGPGVVSMSFGAAEGSWVPSTDSYFTATGMTYLASTGDSGAGVNWPAVSANVLAVGGTSLGYSGSVPRSESAWSGSGGGISAYESLPKYQNGVSIAGGAALRTRAVADVAFNADPNTGQYVALTPPGGAAGWYVYGGTSISSPQWAGMLALVNANRAGNGQAPLGDMHLPLYTQVAEVPGNYAGAFHDITAGADGSCATCRAALGFDQSTGWGTPNFATLLPLLSAAQTLPPLPGATMPGGVGGVAYATAWASTDSARNPLSYTVSGAPAGLTVSSSGAVAWPHPIVGSFRFSVTVKNIAGRPSAGTESLLIAPAPAAPTVPGGSFRIKPTTAWAQSLGASAPANSGTLRFALAGAPAGLTLTTGGVFAWAQPLPGRYTVTVTATNAYGASGSGAYSLMVYGQPAVLAATLKATASKALTARVAATDPNGSALTFSLKGAPTGLTIGAGGALAWAKPVAGTYTLTVTATDTLGIAGSGNLALVVR